MDGGPRAAEGFQHEPGSVPGVDSRSASHSALNSSARSETMRRAGTSLVARPQMGTNRVLRTLRWSLGPDRPGQTPSRGVSDERRMATYPQRPNWRRAHRTFEQRCVELGLTGRLMTLRVSRDRP